MRPLCSWMGRAECELVIDEALGLLERMGMRFGASRCLDLLADAGAEVDRTLGTARIPREVALAAVKDGPREVLLAGATLDDDCLLGGSIVHFSPSGTSTHVLDMDTGRSRPSTLTDERRATIVADAQDAVDIMWPLVTAVDVPAEERLLTDYLTCLSWSPKHLQHEVTTPGQIGAILEMMEILCGGLDELRRRPRVSIVCCTASPLGADGRFLDTCLELIAYGVPAVVYPMPIAGGTAPITVAGTVAVNVAEFLGVATAIRLACPGAPLILGAGASLLDMKTATFSFGALETALMVAACATIGHHLGVPVLCPGLATDASTIGVQAGYEKALKGFVAASAGADLITGGIGLLNGANLLSLPQIVIDGEIATMIKRLLAGADMSGPSVMADVIERVGFAGSYLREKETSRRLRAGEQYYPTIADRSGADGRGEEGGGEAARAAGRARAIVAAAEERGPVVDAARLEALEDVLRRHAVRARA